MGYLMTASLLDAYQWYQDCPESWKEKAYLDLKDTICRTKAFEPNAAVERGMAFEDEICKRIRPTTRFEGDTKILEAPISQEQFLKVYSDPDVIRIMREFYQKCVGGEQQVKVDGSIVVEDMDFYLFGYADVVFPDKTIDIKTTGNYKGPEKYASRAQHLVYMYCRKVYPFEYLVAEFANDRLKEFHPIPIIDTPENTEKRLRGRISNLKHFMEREHLMGDYADKFCKGRH